MTEKTQIVSMEFADFYNFLNKDAIRFNSILGKYFYRQTVNGIPEKPRAKKQWYVLSISIISSSPPPKLPSPLSFIFFTMPT